MRCRRTSGLAVVVVAFAGSIAQAECEIDRLSGLETISFDAFGSSVSIDGDVMAVGSPGAEGGVGAAYLFRRSGAFWHQEGRLTLAGGASGDAFGGAVALSGNILVVGAASGGASDTGIAVVYEFDGATWVERQTLTAHDGAGLDFFGSSVAASGDYIVVGAYGDDDAGSSSGSAYVFVRAGGPASWSFQQKLSAPDGAVNDQFGWSVGLDGDTAVVGANLDDVAAGVDAGSAYVFERGGAVWSLATKLGASNALPGDFFGQSVSISGDAILVGAVSGDGAEANSGSAYVFRDGAGGWSEEDVLTALDGQASDFFGTSVSIDGDLALIGARGEDELGNRAGAAYVFSLTGVGGPWDQAAKLTASDAADDDFLGASVALSEGRAAIGAMFTDTEGMNSGSAYAFVIAGEDCNLNGTPDECEIAAGTEADSDSDGVPDACQSPACVCEWDGTDGVGVFDLLAFLSDWFATSTEADIDGVAGVDVFDALFFLDCWFPASAGAPCP